MPFRSAVPAQATVLPPPTSSMHWCNLPCNLACTVGRPDVGISWPCSIQPVAEIRAGRRRLRWCAVSCDRPCGRVVRHNMPSSQRHGKEPPVPSIVYIPRHLICPVLGSSSINYRIIEAAAALVAAPHAVPCSILHNTRTLIAS